MTCPRPSVTRQHVCACEGGAKCDLDAVSGSLKHMLPQPMPFVHLTLQFQFAPRVALPSFPKVCILLACLAWFKQNAQLVFWCQKAAQHQNGVSKSHHRNSHRCVHSHQLLQRICLATWHLGRMTQGSAKCARKTCKRRCDII